ncbi:MAG: hypothetical protein ACTSUB_04000, partial [Candidatus Thorarchaeota archaeon]
GSESGLPNIEMIIERVQSSITLLKNILTGTPASVVGGSLDDDISFVLTILGTLKPTYLMQETMATKPWWGQQDSVVLFVGFNGYPDFNPSIASKILLESRLQNGLHPQKVANASISLSHESNNITGMELARYFEDEESLSQVISELKGHVSSIGATHIALPPVMGITKPKAILNRIQNETGAIPFELLGFPPSIPGIRLQRSLDIAYRKCGGHLLTGHEVIRYTWTENKLDNVVANSHQRSVTVDSKAYVLASGKYIGGGICATSTGFSEPIFGLPVVSSDRLQVGQELPMNLTHKQAINPLGHEVLSCGIAYDNKLRPIRTSGEPFAENLFAGGSVLSGYDFATEKSGLGVALVTGFVAGSNVASFIQEGSD